MRKAIIFITVILVLAVGPVVAQPQKDSEHSAEAKSNARALKAESLLPSELNSFQELSLDQVVRLALEYSPAIKGQAEVVVQVKSNITRAWAMLLPSLDVGGTYTLTDQEIKVSFGGDTFGDLFRLALANCQGWDTATLGPIPSLCAVPIEDLMAGMGSETIIQQRNNFDASVTASIAILNLRTWPNLANVYTAVELSELQKQFSEEQLVYAITQVYFGISTAQESIKLMAEVLANAMHHMDLTEVRFKNGVALQNERVRAAMSVVQARSALDQAKIAWRLSRESLALLIGLPNPDFRAQDSFSTPWDSLSSPPSTEDIENRRDILMMKKGELLADRNIDDAWMRFFPTIMGVWRWSISSNKGFGNSYDSWRAMITLSWNIFDGGYRFADLDERRARVREIRFNIDQARIQAQTEVARALADIDGAQLAIRTGEETAVLAEENLHIVERQYALGVAPQSAVLDSELQFSQARIQVITARLRLAMAAISLAKASGKLRP